MGGTNCFSQFVRGQYSPHDRQRIRTQGKELKGPVPLSPLNRHLGLPQILCVLLHGISALAMFRAPARSSHQPDSKIAVADFGHMFRSAFEKVLPQQRDHVQGRSREAVPAESQIKVGADRGYDTRGFVIQCRVVRVTPHVLQNSARPRRSPIGKRWEVAGSGGTVGSPVTECGRILPWRATTRCDWANRRRRKPGGCCAPDAPPDMPNRPLTIPTASTPLTTKPPGPSEHALL